MKLLQPPTKSQSIVDQQSGSTPKLISMTHRDEMKTALESVRFSSLKLAAMDKSRKKSLE